MEIVQGHSGLNKTMFQKTEKRGRIGELEKRREEERRTDA